MKVCHAQNAEIMKLLANLKEEDEKILKKIKHQLAKFDTFRELVDKTKATVTQVEEINIYMHKLPTHEQVSTY